MEGDPCFISAEFQPAREWGSTSEDFTDFQVGMDWRRLHDTQMIVLDFQDDCPENRLKNGSFAPQNGPPLKHPFAILSVEGPGSASHMAWPADMQSRRGGHTPQLSCEPYNRQPNPHPNPYPPPNLTHPFQGARNSTS